MALRKPYGRKIVRNAVYMNGGVTLYSVHMGVHKWRAWLYQREQGYYDGIEQFFHTEFDISIAD